MSVSKLEELLALIERVNNSGIKLLRDNEGLKIEFRKETGIEQQLLQELKDKKDDIITYLTTLQNNQPGVIDRISAGCNEIEYEGKRYYDITPTQYYWVSEEKDKEYKETEQVHGAINLVYKIVGEFNPEAFKKAVYFIINRHESLRATFHKINDKYMMRVEGPVENKYDTEFIDEGMLILNKEIVIEELTRRNNAGFSLNDGPLFISRVIRTGEEEYMVIIKLHHVIGDTWSTEVLLQDLLMAYRDLRMNRPPQLNELKYQFRELLAFFNHYRKNNYDADKRYWNGLYDHLPGELKIPGSREIGKQDLKDRIRRRWDVVFPQNLKNRLNLLAKEYNTTLFIILQATFKTFLFCKTSQCDILIGTSVSGRDYPETYDQIGSYARMDLIRTVFDKEETFNSAIEKVKRSNAEMNNYRAFTLTDAMEEIMNGNQCYDTFWKVNMLYVDNSVYHTSQSLEYKQLLEDLNLKITEITEKSNALMPIDMILEFFSIREQLVLNIQYDSSLYEEKTICDMFDDFLSYAHDVTDNVHAAIVKILS